MKKLILLTFLLTTHSSIATTDWFQSLTLLRNEENTISVGGTSCFIYLVNKQSTRPSGRSYTISIYKKDADLCVEEILTFPCDWNSKTTHCYNKHALWSQECKKNFKKTPKNIINERTKIVKEGLSQKSDVLLMHCR